MFSESFTGPHFLYDNELVVNSGSSGHPTWSEGCPSKERYSSAYFSSRLSGPFNWGIPCLLEH